MSGAAGLGVGAREWEWELVGCALRLLVRCGGWAGEERDVGSFGTAGWSFGWWRRGGGGGGDVDAVGEGVEVV